MGLGFRFRDMVGEAASTGVVFSFSNLDTQLISQSISNRRSKIQSNNVMIDIGATAAR